MITLNFKWFVGLSLAAHAAVLVSLPAPPQAPGKSGSLALTLQPQAGQPTTQAAAAAPEQAAQRPAARPPGIPATRTASSAPLPQPRRAEAQRATPAPASTAAPVTGAAATGSTVIMASSPLQAVDAQQRLRDSIMQLLTEELSYPAIARRKGWQGTVRLELHIEADGTVSHLELDQTSGYAVLDRAALQCLQTARIPDAGRWLQGQAIDIVIPVEYRLVDG